MRALLFFILVSSLACFFEAKADPVDVYHAEMHDVTPQLPPNVQSQLQPQPVQPLPQPQPQSEPTTPQAQLEPQPQNPSQPLPQPQQPPESPEPKVAKNIFALAFNNNNETKAQDIQKAPDVQKPNGMKAMPAETVDAEQLQKIIDSFPEEDKRTISAIKVQIATWPKEVFDEISSYREFVISSRRVAKQKYQLLTPEAKSALETERQLKIQLSLPTATTLENLTVATNG